MSNRSQFCDQLVAYPLAPERFECVGSNFRYIGDNIKDGPSYRTNSSNFPSEQSCYTALQQWEQLTNISMCIYRIWASVTVDVLNSQKLPWNRPPYWRRWRAGLEVGVWLWLTLVFKCTYRKCHQTEDGSFYDNDKALDASVFARSSAIEL